jgi:hypothetical protein
VKIVAAVPVWNEDQQTVRRCLLSLEGIAQVYVYQGAVANFLTHIDSDAAARFATSREMRQHGLDKAERWEADWCLQIDCDERLVNGGLLAPLLASGRFSHAFPLPRIEEDGGWGVMPFKCVRVPATLVASCDHFLIAGETWRLSGYPPPPEELRPALLRLPHLVHEPSRRNPPRPVRLGAVEHLERIGDAPVLPLPPLTLTKEPSHA